MHTQNHHTSQFVSSSELSHTICFGAPRQVHLDRKSNLYIMSYLEIIGHHFECDGSINFDFSIYIVWLMHECSTVTPWAWSTMSIYYICSNMVAVIQLAVLENELTIYTTIMFATTSCIYVNKWLEAILMKYVLKHLSKSQNNNDDNIKCVQCSLAKLMFNMLTWSKHNFCKFIHAFALASPACMNARAYGAGSCKHSHTHELEHIPNST